MDTVDVLNLLHIVEPFYKEDTVDVLNSLHIVEPFYKVDIVETRHLGANTYSDGMFQVCVVYFMDFLHIGM